MEKNNAKKCRPCPFRSERHRDGSFFERHPLKKSVSVLSETEGQESRSETEVLQMQEITESTRDTQLDEELADVLIAISVIAKRLARKLQAVNQEGGTTDGENERTGCAV